MAKREAAQLDAWSRELRSHGSLSAGSLGAQRGPNPMLNARRDSSPNHRACSPRGAPVHTVGANNSYTKLLAITKDHESMCSHLLSTARTLDEQIRTLRAEHEALRVEAQAMRRCLDRAGVLPTSDLEKEIQHCTPAIASPPASTACSDSSPSAATTTTAGGSVATSVPHAIAEAQPSEASSPSMPAEGEAVGLHASSASTPSLNGQGNSPPNRGEEQAEDLFDLAAPLLDRVSSMSDQQRAVRAVQRHLKDHPEPPNSWRGPGTPLWSAVKASRVDLARLLLRAKANANEKDAKGVSALHLATFDGNTDICRALLVARADVDSCDRHGQTSLFFAPTREVCKLLVEKRADVTVLNRKGQSALHLAGRAGLSEVLGWLSTRVSKQLLELKDIHGATARYYAQQTGACPPMPEERPNMKSRGGSSGGAGVVAAAQASYIASDQSHNAESHLRDLPSSMSGIEVGQLPSVSEIIEEGRSSQEQSPDIDTVGGTAQDSGRRPSLPSVSMIVEAASTPAEPAVRGSGAAAIEEEQAMAVSDAKKDLHMAARSKASPSSAPNAYPVKSWSKPAQVVVPASTRRKPEMPKAALNRSSTPNKIQTPRAGDSPASNHSGNRDSPMKRLQSSAAPSPARSRTPATAATPARSNGEVRTVLPRTQQPTAQASAVAHPGAQLPETTAAEPAAQPSAAPSLQAERQTLSATSAETAAAALPAAAAAPDALAAAPAHEAESSPLSQSAPLDSEVSSLRQPDSAPVDQMPEKLGTDLASVPAPAPEHVDFTDKQPKSTATANPEAAGKVEEFSLCDADSSNSQLSNAYDPQHRNSLEIMYEEGFGQAHSLNRVVDEPAARTEVDTKLHDAAVSSSECDDTGAFDNFTLRPEDAAEPTSHPPPVEPAPVEPACRADRERGSMSAEEAAALAEAGVFDGDLGDEVGFDLKDSMAADLDAQDASGIEPANNADEDDLAAIGVLTEDDISLLHSPTPHEDAADLAEAGVICDDAAAAEMAALAAEGVIDVGGEEDLDDLADCGVYEGDDGGMEEAGIIFDSLEARRNRRLSAVQEGICEDDEEGCYEEEDCEDEEEEEEYDGDEIDDDELEEAW